LNLVTKSQIATASTTGPWECVESRHRPLARLTKLGVYIAASAKHGIRTGSADAMFEAVRASRGVCRIEDMSRPDLNSGPKTK